ncbi:hypothetical protein DFQ05_0942 [Winogradskyella wandonensis]|uniref:Uncharacterized protein n=1 Tax=Winogradskyella wandonensis TaxID=1442586 RepID=A0A4V2PU87_9FLAO|nr:hypothetical protein DFQ05_0942 [Winogradskyella wandonensis]
MKYDKSQLEKLIYFPIQYLTTLMFISVNAFGQQIGYKKRIKRVNKG